MRKPDPEKLKPTPAPERELEAVLWRCRTLYSRTLYSRTLDNGALVLVVLLRRLPGESDDPPSTIATAAAEVG